MVVETNNNNTALEINLPFRSANYACPSCALVFTCYCQCPYFRAAPVGFKHIRLISQQVTKLLQSDVHTAPVDVHSMCVTLFTWQTIVKTIEMHSRDAKQYWKT
jgi:hypothetical protein